MTQHTTTAPQTKEQHPIDTLVDSFGNSTPSLAALEAALSARYDDSIDVSMLTAYPKLRELVFRSISAARLATMEELLAAEAFLDMMWGPGLTACGAYQELHAKVLSFIGASPEVLKMGWPRAGGAVSSIFESLGAEAGSEMATVQH